MKDDRLIDVYDVTTGKLVDRLTQEDALKRILIHCCCRPIEYNLKGNRYRIDDMLKGSQEKYGNLFYCCTEPEPERVPTPIEPNPTMHRVSCGLCSGTGKRECRECDGTGSYWERIEDSAVKPIMTSEQHECPNCKGSGLLVVGLGSTYDCEQCKGTGNLD